MTLSKENFLVTIKKKVLIKMLSNMVTNFWKGQKIVYFEKREGFFIGPTA